MVVLGRLVSAMVRLLCNQCCALSHSSNLDSIYRIPLQAPLSTIREIKSRAALLDTVMTGVEIKHPLVSAPDAILGT